jgi:arabinogalactan oligomer/maltooligosaccharide transport system permease protein
MRTNKKSILKLILVAVLFLGVSLLSGCVKRSDDVYFLRSVVREHTVGFQEGNDESYVTGNVTLDNNYEGVEITWKSSNLNLVSETGVVTLPDKDEYVTLTATYKIANHTKNKAFKLHIISQESIDNIKSSDALNRIMLLETTNNQTNYLAAKAALELVPTSHSTRESLVSRFLVQEKIREADQRVKDFLALPTTEEFNAIMQTLNELPEHNQYVVNYKSQLNQVEPHLAVGDKVKALIENKTQAAYDDALISVNAIEPASNPARTSLMLKLNLVKQYLENLAKLNLNNTTQEELELIIHQDFDNQVILPLDRANLESNYNTNQQRLFNALPDKGYSYVDSMIESLREKQSLSAEEKYLLEHLIYSYYSPKQDELIAKHRILVLSKDPTEDNLWFTQNANNEVQDVEVKAQNQIIIDDFALVISLNEKFSELDQMKNGDIVVSELNDKILEVKTDGSNLTLPKNIEWFEGKVAMYDVVHEIIAGANEIKTIPLAHAGTELHPLVKQISDTKVLTNSTVLSSEHHLRNELVNLIEANTLLRLEEIKELNETEKSEANRVLIGQLLGQTVSKDYGTYMIRSYKEGLDRDVRLSQSSALVGKIVLIFILIVVFFVSQALTADYASKKGYEGIVASLISLIPIGGWLYFYKQPKRRNVSKSGIKSVYKPSEIFAKLVIYAQIVFTAIIVIVPIVYIFGMAFSNMKTDIPNQIWPTNPNWESFNYLFNETKFKTWWLNTVSIALINMLVGTVLITGASYVFARFNFKGKKAGLMTILVLQSFPSFMGLIAMYVLFDRFGLLGQPLALTILYIGGGIPGNIWLIKGFMDQIPKDLDESAMIDGANKLQIFFRIIMPLAVPILTFVAVNMFMAPWMDYMLPGYLLNIPRAGAPIDYDITEQWTLAVGLFKLINDPNTLNYSAFAAGALIVGIPITLLYMFFQKYLIEGIMAGATKG